MAWTGETILAEFRTHITYWKEKLRLRDLVINPRITSESDPSESDDWWCAVKRGNYGANPYDVDFRIHSNRYHNETRYEVWATVAHELVHVLNWPMAHAVSSLTDHFSKSQMNMVNSLLKEGNEAIAYKWESILTEWFKADAPPREIP